MNRVLPVTCLSAGLVLAILLHVLLMAAQADAAMSVHAVGPVHAVHGALTACAGPVTDCFTVRDATRAPAAPVAITSSIAVEILPPPLVEQPSPAFQIPPRHPPDIARALLQVYRN